MTKFLKMHGLGNDFAVFDARPHPLCISPDLAIAIANRRTGIGCDTVVLITPGKDGFDAGIQFFNADGGEVESCGNASRCVASLIMEETGKAEVRLATRGGALTCRNAGGGDVTVDMGVPGLSWEQIPMASEADTNAFTIDVDGARIEAASASMGNPHVVLFVEDAESAPLETLGPKLEHHAMFPNRTNVEFVTVRDKGHIRMRVWERGNGVTMACGTGACAVVVAAARRGLTGRKAVVELDGGELAIEWRADDHVLMTGPVALSYGGDIDLAALLT